MATALSVRDRLIESWNDSQQFFHKMDPKRVYYLSMEFLIGRCLQSTLINMDLEENYRAALHDLGYRLEELYDEETDAALGNGGLGRLAACFLDSLATLNYPAWGYGLRYEYGMFQQVILNGHQVEHPDYWLNFGSPWEIQRLDVQYPICFYGHVVSLNGRGVRKKQWEWKSDDTIRAVAHDMPITGYDTYNTINLRLWAAKPAHEFDLGSFHQGDYLAAIAERQRAENITRVLYPNDNMYTGKELRLKQQYFFVSATLQDILRRFKRRKKVSYGEMTQKVTIQLNDTHPSIGIPEMMRLLIDKENLDYEDAWELTQKVFAYTNHTVLPEALEKWPVDLVSHLLPRHIQIIYEINARWLQTVEERWPKNIGMMQKLSIIEESFPRAVRMGHLSVIGCHSVNGVAEIHSNLVKTSVFPDFVEVWPDKFNNKTNGVTPRRWVLQANPQLAAMVSRWIESDEWIKDLTLLSHIRPSVGTPELQREFSNVKIANKIRLANYIKQVCDTDVDPHAMFDIHVKRIHEYKRQLLNILGVIYQYLQLKKRPLEERRHTPARVVIFAGKAAPGYFIAKKVIKLVHNVARVVNNDASLGGLLKVIFIPNYCVSNAEIIIPAADISQQISTAGTEASGTGNMKFVMNGAIILGTMDGANIEIREEIGEENIFVFGARAHEIEQLRHQERLKKLGRDSRFLEVLKAIRDGQFGGAEDTDPIMNCLEAGHDYYLHAHDFPSYIEALEDVAEIFRDHEAWVKKCLLGIAGMGKFSSDRTIREYAEHIWKAEPCERPDPRGSDSDRDSEPSVSPPGAR
eukprot:TRINITY_DN33057_c0_g1_i1.p1 TRINITY_DN33057_c0_g1~~TRINITY_DN33057_c0_g1_i1.p1  ORF type:complete len:923 (-),score=171.57 TRINITY_DN33057_c0_g1_i1:45-2453(-)